jgi:hypothetical protein
MYSLIVAFLSCQYMTAQLVDVQEKYTENLKQELAKFSESNRVVGDKYLNEKVDVILKNVIFNNSDITTTGSSVSIVQGEDKTSLTAAIVNPLSNLASLQTFLKAGVYAKGKDNIFNFYTDDSWKNEIGLNVGIILKMPGSVFFDGNKRKEINENRSLFADSIRTEKYKYFSEENIKIIQQKRILDSIISLRTKWINGAIEEKDFSYDAIKKALQKSLENDPTIKNCNDLLKCPKPTGCPDILDCSNLPDYGNLIDEIEKKGILRVKDSINGIYKKYNSLVGKNENEIENLIKNELYQFDKKYDITEGYRLHWIAVEGSIGNSTLKIPNDSILTTQELSLYNLKKFDNNLTYNIGTNYNFTHNKNYLIFAQLGVKADFGDFLDSNLFTGKPSLELVEDEYILYNEDREFLGVYRNLDRTFSTANFNGYFSVFFTKKKNIGLFLSATHNALIRKPNRTYFQNNYSAIVGPLFRQVDKDNNTKAVFGIQVGYENTPYDLRAKDFFIARAKIGIPFNVYNKKTGN